MPSQIKKLLQHCFSYFSLKPKKENISLKNEQSTFSTKESETSSLSEFLKKKNGLNTIYLYGKQNHPLYLHIQLICAELNIKVQDCPDVDQWGLSQFPKSEISSRLFIGAITEKDLPLLQQHHLSGYFFEACFVIEMDWRCVFVDWSSAFSTEQTDAKGIFRGASLESNIFPSLTISTVMTQDCPLPSLCTNPSFSWLYCNEKKILEDKSAKKNFSFSIPFSDRVHQYFIWFPREQTESTYFQIRDLKSYPLYPSPQSALFLLQSLHRLGFMSIASVYRQFEILTQFSYFESGFQIHKIINVERDLESSLFTFVYANKYSFRKDL